MPMRVECKHFESRTYASGDTVRKCNLDLAPDAPWRCPSDCPRFERRLADVAWSHGSLIAPRTPEEPPGLDDGTAAAVLDEAENIINAIAGQTAQDIDLERVAEAQRAKGFRRLFGRKRQRPTEDI